MPETKSYAVVERTDRAGRLMNWNSWYAIDSESWIFRWILALWVCINSTCFKLRGRCRKLHFAQMSLISSHELAIHLVNYRSAARRMYSCDKEPDQFLKSAFSNELLKKDNGYAHADKGPWKTTNRLRRTHRRFEKTPRAPRPGSSDRSESRGSRTTSALPFVKNYTEPQTTTTQIETWKQATTYLDPFSRLRAKFISI